MPIFYPICVSLYFVIYAGFNNSVTADHLHGCEPTTRHSAKRREVLQTDLGTVLGLRREDFRRRCRACCRAWTRCWSQSQRSWCSCRCLAAGSPPGDKHMPCETCHNKMHLNLQNVESLSFSVSQVMNFNVTPRFLKYVQQLCFSLIAIKIKEKFWKWHDSDLYYLLLGLQTYTAQFLQLIITQDNHTTRHCCHS